MSMSIVTVTSTSDSCSAQQTTLEQLRHLNYQSCTSGGAGGGGGKSVLYGAASSSSLLANAVTRARTLADLVDTNRCIFLKISDLEEAVVQARHVGFLA